jgi:hypothetical protein
MLSFKRLRKTSVWMLALMGVLLGCAQTSTDVPRTPDMSSVPPRENIVATVSDAGDWSMFGGFTVRQSCDGAEFLLQLSGRGRPGEEGALGFTLKFNQQRAQELVAGMVVYPENNSGAMYVVSSGMISRPIQSIQMTVMPALWFSAELVLGAPVPVSGTPPTDLASTATIRVVGAISMSCERFRQGVVAMGAEDGGTCGGIVVSDPNFTSDVCRNAVRDFGLGPLRGR